MVETYKCVTAPIIVDVIVGRAFASLVSQDAMQIFRNDDTFITFC